MVSFEDIYGGKIEAARIILEQVSEDIWDRYPDNDFIGELDEMIRRLDEMKANMSSYPV